MPERRAVLLDITCDSDGAIDHYIDGDGIATTMPMPEYDPEVRNTDPYGRRISGIPRQHAQPVR